MKYNTILYLILFFIFGCVSEKKITVKNERDFYNNYTKVFYVQPKLEEGEYELIEDTVMYYNKIFYKIELMRSEVDTLISILKSPKCYSDIGECGTYYDQGCFLFFNDEVIIKSICVGCSYTQISNCPNEWPCSKNRIDGYCDTVRWERFLDKIWKRIPPEK